MVLKGGKRQHGRAEEGLGARFFIDGIVVPAPVLITLVQVRFMGFVVVAMGQKARSAGSLQKQQDNKNSQDKNGAFLHDAKLC
jgi:hypothetical protein